MKKFVALLLTLAMCLALAACGAPEAKEEAAAPAPQTEAPAQEEPFNNQQMRIGDKVYDRMLKALMEQTDSEITIVLESDLLMTGSAIILGTSDYGGMFQGNSITITPTDITLDLNGFSITGEEGMPIFEVQSGYTLTVVDSSAGKTGKLVTRGDTDVLVDGGTYNPLG